MRHFLKGFPTIGAAACLILAACFGSDHPDRTKYEYLYSDGRFVAPYTEFPVGREREKWQCFDDKTKRTFDCTFVRGGWDQYRFIFRKRE